MFACIFTSTHLVRHLGLKEHPSEPFFLVPDFANIPHSVFPALKRNRKNLLTLMSFLLPPWWRVLCPKRPQG
jgi:hypothetical protein